MAGADRVGIAAGARALIPLIAMVARNVIGPRPHEHFERFEAQLHAPT